MSGCIYYERVALNMEWWSLNCGLVILSKNAQVRTFLTEDILMRWWIHYKKCIQKVLYVGWMNHYTLTRCMTVNLHPFIHPPQKKKGSGCEVSPKAAASLLATRRAVIVAGCQNCLLWKMVIFDVKMGSKWLTAILVSLPPRTPGAEAR